MANPEEARTVTKILADLDLAFTFGHVGEGSPTWRLEFKDQDPAREATVHVFISDDFLVMFIRHEIEVPPNKREELMKLCSMLAIARIGLDPGSGKLLVTVSLPFASVNPEGLKLAIGGVVEASKRAQDVLDGKENLDQPD